MIRSSDERWLKPVPNVDGKTNCLIHDRDGKFSSEFHETLKQAGVKPAKLSVRSPNLNARCERYVKTIEFECLNHFIIFGKRHLDHLVTQSNSYYNRRRAHSARDYLPPACSDPPAENNSVELDRIARMPQGTRRTGQVVRTRRRVTAVVR